MREAVESWIRRLDGFADSSVRDIERVSDGYSNISWRLELEGAPVSAALLRQQPEHGIFEPYDLVREARVLEALADTAVPVPRVLGWDAEGSTLGAPIVLLEWIDAPHLGAAPPEDAAGGFGAFVEMLVEIHHVDWKAAGLAFLGVPASPADAFAAEVEAVAQRMPGFGNAGESVLQEALVALRAVRVEGGRLALCHGDANVFNYLVRDGRIVGVVDWEQARIGDPRSDLGQLIALSHLKGEPFGPVADVLVVQLHDAAAGEPSTGLEPFRALWFFELAVILGGLSLHTHIDPWYSWADVTRLLGHALHDL